jgi:hypothetical protein
MPRPTKLTDHVANQIVLAVKGASTFKTAAKYAGIGETTFYSWLSGARAELERIELATDKLEALPKRVRSDKARKARRVALRRKAEGQRAALPRISRTDPAGRCRGPSPRRRADCRRRRKPTAVH